MNKSAITKKPDTPRSNMFPFHSMSSTNLGRARANETKNAGPDEHDDSTCGNS